MAGNIKRIIRRRNRGLFGALTGNLQKKIKENDELNAINTERFVEDAQK